MRLLTGSQQVIATRTITSNLTPLRLLLVHQVLSNNANLYTPALGTRKRISTMNTLIHIKEKTTYSKKRHLQILIVGFSSLLVACGGSGSNGQASEASTPSTLFSPEPGRLNSSASESRELYAKNDFDFDQTQNVSLTINSTGVDGQPLGNAKVIVYALNEKFADSQSIGESDRELIASGRTNILGSLEKKLELGPQAKQLLISVAGLGIENKKLLTIRDIVSVNFAALE